MPANNLSLVEHDARHAQDVKRAGHFISSIPDLQTLEVDLVKVPEVNTPDHWNVDDPLPKFETKSKSLQEIEIENYKAVLKTGEPPKVDWLPNVPMPGYQQADESKSQDNLVHENSTFEQRLMSPQIPLADALKFVDSNKQ